MRRSHKTLLSVEVYEFTGKDIGELRNQYQYDRYLSRILPKYTINKEFGNILDADGYLQFVENGDEVYTLFDILTIDNLLNEEISNGGLENIFKNNDIRPFLDKMNKKKYKDFKRSLTSAEYLIIEIIYNSGDYFDSEYDVSVDINVVGALVGNNLDTIQIKECKTI